MKPVFPAHRLTSFDYNILSAEKTVLFAGKEIFLFLNKQRLPAAALRLPSRVELRLQELRNRPSVGAGLTGKAVEILRVVG